MRLSFSVFIAAMAALCAVDAEQLTSIRGALTRGIERELGTGGSGGKGGSKSSYYGASHSSDDDSGSSGGSGGSGSSGGKGKGGSKAYPTRQ